MPRDLYSNIKISKAIPPQTQTNADTAFVSAILDTANYDSNMVAIQLGAWTDADATLVVLLEDGNDSALGDNAAVADAYMIGTEAGATFLFSEDLDVTKLAYIGQKRYLRLTITPTNNNSGALPISALWIQGNPRTSFQTTQKTAG